MKTKILQFGEGNFLRGFFDWMVQRMNERSGFDGGVFAVQPACRELRPVSRALNAQGGRYHVCFRGLEGGRPVERLEEIACLEGVGVPEDAQALARDPALRFVVSNTTEAGIQYVPGADTFPAKVLRLLRARRAAGLPGLVFLPCELVEENGEALKSCILRHCADEGDAATAAWIESDCVFCSTLVDRIVPGRPGPEDAARLAARCGGADAALVCCEPYHLFAVKAPPGFDLEAELPLAKSGLNVEYADDLAPFRTLKVRFLNATHTTIARLGLERGFSEVAPCVADAAFGAFVRRVVFDEILPTVSVPEDRRRAYAESVLERFANPFAHHRLESIALNSAAKWRVRCLPVVCDYFKLEGRLPEAMMQGWDAIARHFDGLDRRARP